MYIHAILMKILGKIFVDIDKITLKFIWKNKSTRIAKTALKKNKNVEGISLRSFKTLYNYSNQVCEVLAEG